MCLLYHNKNQFAIVFFIFDKPIFKKIVGHSKSSNITKTVYTHVRDEAMEKAIAEYNKKLKN